MEVNVWIKLDFKKCLMRDLCDHGAGVSVDRQFQLNKFPTRTSPQKKIWKSTRRQQLLEGRRGSEGVWGCSVL